MQNIYEPEFVKRLFNQMSGSYERMNFITSFGFSIIWRRQFLKKLGSYKTDIQAIDLLSGLGENWNTLKKKYPKATIHALDFSEEMVIKSQKKNGKSFKNSIHILHENVLKNELPTNHFDIVSCALD